MIITRDEILLLKERLFVRAYLYTRDRSFKFVIYSTKKKYNFEMFKSYSQIKYLIPYLKIMFKKRLFTNIILKVCKFIK